MRAPLIALLTDFGTRDWYAAVLKAVLLSRCPEARLIDITHDIPPQDTVAGAFILAAAMPWFPPGTVFLAVVDPGVGSDRVLVAAKADGRYFVGPDNGLLTLSLQRATRVTAVRLTNSRYWHTPVSATFQGRDIMAPVAAHLASGGSLARVGQTLPRLTPLSLPAVRQVGSTLKGHVVHIDAFGNLITNLPASSLAPLSGSRGVAVRYKRRAVRVVSSYAAGGPSELVAVAGSVGLVELALCRGSAAWTFNAARGDEVEVRRT
jgi:S-adenosylmethionine hydrolase